MPNLYNHIGPLKAGATLVDETGFDTLNANGAFIKRQLTLVIDKDTRAPLANPEYLEFANSPKGRAELLKSGLDQKLIDAIILVWGNTPIVSDPIMPD